jgi:hypothetical protein
MTDDDLRFGDISGGGGDSENDIIDTFRRIIIGLIMFYVLLVVLETLFNVPVPFV